MKPFARYLAKSPTVSVSTRPLIFVFKKTKLNPDSANGAVLITILRICGSNSGKLSLLFSRVGIFLGTPFVKYFTVFTGRFMVP